MQNNHCQRVTTQLQLINIIIIYQTVRRHSTEDSIVYCYRCHDIASHMECRSHRVCSLPRHFPEHKVESCGGIEIWLVVQGRGENRRRKSEEMLLFLNYGILEWRCVCVCLVTVPITNSVHTSYCLHSSPPAANTQTPHISIPQSILFTNRWEFKY